VEELRSRHCLMPSLSWLRSQRASCCYYHWPWSLLRGYALDVASSTLPVGGARVSGRASALLGCRGLPYASPTVALRQHHSLLLSMLSNSSWKGTTTPPLLTNELSGLRIGTRAQALHVAAKTHQLASLKALLAHMLSLPVPRGAAAEMRASERQQKQQQKKEQQQQHEERQERQEGDAAEEESRTATGGLAEGSDTPSKYKVDAGAHRFRHGIARPPAAAVDGSTPAASTVAATPTTTAAAAAARNPLCVELLRRVDACGRTAAAAAAAAGATEVLEVLLAHGAMVDAKDLKGRTPLHHAAYAGHADCVQVCNFLLPISYHPAPP
jgi:hypothetical protein